MLIHISVRWEPVHIRSYSVRDGRDYTYSLNLKHLRQDRIIVYSLQLIHNYMICIVDNNVVKQNSV